MSDTDRIDAYLARLPDDQRITLQSLRDTIAGAAPEAEEGISYGVPAFRYRTRPLVSYAAAKGHLSFFPMSPEVLDRYRSALDGFSMDKGTIRFTPDQPIPPDVIGAIVRDRVAQLDESSASKRRG